MSRPCEYVLTFMPLWKALSFFCAWPQNVTKGGRLVRSLFSVKTFITAITFSVSCWRAWVHLQYRIQFHNNMPKDEFPRKLLNIQFAIYILPLFCIALMIYETGRLARYAARWHEFQPALQRVCGAPLRADGLRGRVKYTALALSVGWPLAIIVPLQYAGEQSHLTVTEVIYYSYITTVLTFCSTNWRMHCAFLGHASQMLVTALRQALRKHNLSAKEVSRLARTWVELRELVHGGVHAVELTTLLNISILTLTLVLCTYNTMYILFNGFSKLGIFLSGVGILTGTTYYRIFNAGHVVSQELGSNTALALATAEVSRWPEETLQELNTFRLILATSPVRMSVLGYLPVDRRVLGALWATMCTYLVVLVQFTVDG